MARPWLSRDVIVTQLVLAGVLGVSAGAAYSQVLVAADRLPALIQSFEPLEEPVPLRCDVDTIPAQLNFSLRFQAGYVARVPGSQFAGSGHRLRTLIKITPEKGLSPVFLTSFTRTGNVPRTNGKFELRGSYVVGPGRYTVEWMIADEDGRQCRKNWRMEAGLGSDDRNLKTDMAAGMVTEASFRRWSLESSAADFPLSHLTILLHAAPLVPNLTRLRLQDRMMLLASLASLLDSLPARSVRLVVFNLDQQRELFRQDELKPEAFPKIAQAISDLQLQLIDYHLLANQHGPADVMATLIKEETEAKPPADAVIFLGPPSRSF